MRKVQQVSLLRVVRPQCVCSAGRHPIRQNIHYAYAYGCLCCGGSAEWLFFDISLTGFTRDPSLQYIGMFVVSTPARGHAPVDVFGGFLGWGGLIKFIRTSTHTSCYATGRFLGLPHTPNQLHIHTTHTKTADKTCPNSRSTVLVCCCGAKPSQARFSTNLANFVLELKKQGETFARRSGHTN